MAKERIFFLCSFAFLGLIAALLFRHTDVKEVKQIEQKKETPTALVERLVEKEVVKPPEKKNKIVSEALPLATGKIGVPFQPVNKYSVVQILSPGMFVDIIFTSKADIGFGTVTINLLKNIRVLDIGKEEAKEGNKTIIPVEILFEMTPRE